MNPPEGSVVAYEFGYQDYNDEYWGLALYRIVGNDLAELIHPEMDGPQDEKSLEEKLNILLKDGITELAAPIHYREWRGISTYWFGTEHEVNPESHTVDQWAEYRQLTRGYGGEDMVMLLHEKGFSIIPYEVFGEE